MMIIIIRMKLKFVFKKKLILLKLDSEVFQHFITQDLKNTIVYRAVSTN